MKTIYECGKYSPYGAMAEIIDLNSEQDMEMLLIYISDKTLELVSSSINDKVGIYIFRPKK